ncbi:hypothetical protein [Streptomyces venezuelae]|nr:hypothetical protein [Streptomyces venezuelae]
MTERTVRTGLDPAAFTAAFTRGATLTAEAAVAEAALSAEAP